MKLVVILCLFSLSLFAQDEESEALRAMRLSCEKQKVALGCFNHANMLARLEKNEEADKAYEMGCKLGNSSSCKKEKWELPAPATAKVPEEIPVEPKETVLLTPESTLPSPSEEPIAPPSEEPIAPPSEEPIAPPSEEPTAPPSEEPMPASEAELSVPESTDMSLDTGDTINQ